MDFKRFSRLTHTQLSRLSRRRPHTKRWHLSCFTGTFILQLNSSNAFANLTQVTAAIIALLNDARLRAGKPVLGFLNPWIYSSGYKGFTDITAGQSDGCNGYNTQTGSGVNGVSHAANDL
jgi:hypothetical protein